MSELAIRNATIVLPGEVVRGSILVRDGVIADISSSSGGIGEDLEGEYLLPGLVELHTDHFESHYRPRLGVTWNAFSALQSHDAQIAGAGITTVFDAIRIGSDPVAGDIGGDVANMVDAVETCSADGRLRAEHFLHLRCEVPSHDCATQFAAHCDRPIVRLASVMDHTPGARQYTTLEHYIAYYRRKLHLSDAEMAAFISDRRAEHDKYAERNRAAILGLGREIGLAFASHDDATTAHVEEALRDGMRIAEFPTTMEAAAAAHSGGLATLMGAPNVVRGKSHNGNVSAVELARRGMLDVISSDYVPFALLQAALLLPDLVDDLTLPAAVAMVTSNPALAAGLSDRGEIAIGKRADLVWAKRIGDLPVVRSVWRQGRRVS